MSKQKRVAVVLSNKAVSSVTGWPIGLWLAELTHAYAEFADTGFEITLLSPDGGALYSDDFSDPYADNGYSADDEISQHFLENPDTKTLLDVTDSNGDLIVAGKEWTGFTKAEEEYVEQNLGQKFQPFWIENEAAKIDNTTFVAAESMSAHAIRSGNLITGQQQNSSTAAAKLVIEDVG